MKQNDTPLMDERQALMEAACQISALLAAMRLQHRPRRGEVFFGARMELK